MNTYQMHTLSLSLFYHIFLFFVFLTHTLSAHFLSVVLMVRHTDVTYSAVLYNSPL